MAYKNNSENEQDRLRRNAELQSCVPGRPDETDEEKRATLRRIAHRISCELQFERDPFRRKRLAAEKRQVDHQLSVYKIHFAKKIGFDRFIVDVAKERLPKATWAGILKEATERHDAHTRAQQAEGEADEQTT